MRSLWEISQWDSLSKSIWKVEWPSNCFKQTLLKRKWVTKRKNSNFWNRLDKLTVMIKFWTAFLSMNRKLNASSPSSTTPHSASLWILLAASVTKTFLSLVSCIYSSRSWASITSHTRYHSFQLSPSTYPSRHLISFSWIDLCSGKMLNFSISPGSF